jgi:hypothetical protein
VIHCKRVLERTALDDATTGKSVDHTVVHSSSYGFDLHIGCAGEKFSTMTGI